MGLFKKKNYDEKAEEIIEKALPEDVKSLKKLVKNLTDELMEKSKQCVILEKELKQAVRRKKAQRDPMAGNVALVLFSKPKAEGARIRMHVVDNVHANLAIQNLKRLLKDPDNDFVAAHFLQEMKGKPDGYQRLLSNTESTWHLFEKLDKDCTTQDPSAKKE